MKPVADLTIEGKSHVPYPNLLLVKEGITLQNRESHVLPVSLNVPLNVCKN